MRGRRPRRTNSGRKVTTVRIRSRRPSARNCWRNSSVDASAQCRSSTTNRTGRRSEYARSHSHEGAKRLLPFPNRRQAERRDSGVGGKRQQRSRTAARDRCAPGHSPGGGARDARTGRTAPPPGRGPGTARRTRSRDRDPCSGGAASSATRRPAGRSRPRAHRHRRIARGSVPPCSRTSASACARAATCPGPARRSGARPGHRLPARAPSGP